MSNDFIMESFMAAVKEMEISEITDCVRNDTDGNDFKSIVVNSYYEGAYKKGLMTEGELISVKEKIEKSL